MVSCADANESDVVIGKMVGTNGRYVHQKLYTGNRDVTLDDPELPFTLANTKLFRRELIEKHGLRFPEDMPVGSDQPFTIEASYPGRFPCSPTTPAITRSSVATPATSPTGRTTWPGSAVSSGSWSTRPRSIRGSPARRRVQAALRLGADQAPAEGLPALDADTRRQVCEGVGVLVDAYFTDGLRDGTGVKRRVRFGLARSGAVEELTRAVAEETAHGAPPFLLEGGRAFATYPGFRDPAVGLDDRWYEVLGETVAAASPPVRAWSRPTGTSTARN
ncbi:hypothetical protein SBADM41S_00960 [Streptomyces badius]